MKILYWEGFDCTEESRYISHPSTIHFHSDNEQELYEAFIKNEQEWAYYRDNGIARYRCVKGPGGLVRGFIK